jgi:hypothetical protein
MQDGGKLPIAQRWWFKLIFGSISGAFHGVGHVWQGWRNSSKRVKLGIGAAFAIFVVLAAVSGQRDASRAKSLGFASSAEMREAEKAGFHDNAAWMRHQAEVAAQAQAAEAAKSQGAPAPVKGKTIGEWLDEQSANRAQVEQPRTVEPQSSGDSQVMLDGNTRGWWRRLCRRFEQAKNDCAVADRVQSCVDIKMGEELAYKAVNDCDGLEPKWTVTPDK